MRKKICGEIDEELYHQFKALASMKFKFAKRFSADALEEAIESWVKEHEEIFLVKQETKNVIGDWINKQVNGD